MRVIIAGGTGLIGRALADSLTNDGHEVVVLSRSPKSATTFPKGVTVERWDGQTSEGWGRLINGETAVVNLAGEGIAAGRWTVDRKLLLRNSRLHAAQALVQAVEQAREKPKVVVQASAVGYYGPRSINEELAEDAPPGDDFLARLCVDWERSINPLVEMGVRHVMIRTGVVLSRDGGALPRMLLPFRLFIGGPLGTGTQPFPWINLSDEVGAIRFLLATESAQGAFNLTAPRPLTNAEFSHILGRVLGRPSSLPTPAFALRIFFGEMATVLLDGQGAVPRRLLDLGYQFHYADAEAALRKLLG